MSDKIIEMQNVNKWFDDFQVLKDINLIVGQKQKIVVCGPSGSGKSTLIRCINRLEEHQQGKIIIDGIELTENTKNIEQIRAEVGMVFQSFNLFPHLTVLENCTLGPIWVRQTPKLEAEEAAMHYLERVKIPEQAQKYPGQLSGGQQQRALLARTLNQAASVFLLDEPCSSLDPVAREKFLTLVRQLADAGLTIVVSSHDWGKALNTYDKVITLDRTVLAFGTPDEVRSKLLSIKSMGNHCCG